MANQVAKTDSQMEILDLQMKAAKAGVETDMKIYKDRGTKDGPNTVKDVSKIGWSVKV